MYRYVSGKASPSGQGNSSIFPVSPLRKVQWRFCNLLNFAMHYNYGECLISTLLSWGGQLSGYDGQPVFCHVSSKLLFNRYFSFASRSGTVASIQLPVNCHSSSSWRFMELVHKHCDHSACILHKSYSGIDLSIGHELLTRKWECSWNEQFKKTIRSAHSSVLRKHTRWSCRIWSKRRSADQVTLRDMTKGVAK